MNAIVETLNMAGRAFVEFALPMLIQSSVLILILLAVDAVLRRRVRAVFRYWIWMLVLVKLVLPPSLGSPVSVGTWFGDVLEVPTATLFEPEPPQAAEPPATELSPVVSALLSPPDPAIVQSLMPLPGGKEYSKAGATPTQVPEPVASVQTSVVSLNWQGLVLLIWAVVALALTLLLIQRAYFVRGLVGQSDEAGPSMLDELETCRRRLGLRTPIGLRFSPNAASPAICGLLRPVILIPQTLAPRLRSHDLQAVLLHELAHVKRGDLWVNLAQTLLQIAYFYNPLWWLANTMIRRTREQAVDEAVLVAMGETARQYPETLINIAKLAFTRRPGLSLRLIGVVESKSALAGRIRHMLNRPIPKTARLGLIGLIVVAITAAVLLPMARAAEGTASVDNQGPLDIRLVGVCPDGGDELYDADGRKLDRVMGFLGGNSNGPWDGDEQNRDFVLQTRGLDKQVLFLPVWLRAAGTDRTVGGGMVASGGAEDPSTLILSSTMDREYPKPGAPAFKSTLARVDLSLKYFHGPRREALCTFTGPFVPGKIVQADQGRPYRLTPKPVASGDGTVLEFHFSTGQPFASDVPVILHDRQGRRYLAGGASGGSGPQGADLTYHFMGAVPWEEIAAVAVGEKPYEITFRNIAVRYPDRPPQSHAAYLDVMAQRLGLTDKSPEQLRQYTVKNPQEAIAVLDVVRGDWHIRTTFEALDRARPPVSVSELDRASQQRIREVAARWAGSASVSHYGIQLGLMGRWPEFFDLAMDRLGGDPAMDSLVHQQEQRWREANSEIASSLFRYWTEPSASQVESIRQLILGVHSGPVLNSLFLCLRNAKSKEATDALWTLAQNDKPWIWWKAIDAWYTRMIRTRGGYDDLPEEIRARLFLVKGRADDQAFREKALMLLTPMFTPELGTMAPEAWGAVRDGIVREFDRETATRIYLDYLRRMQSAMTPRRWLVDFASRLESVLTTASVIRSLNVWYGIDIGHLGTDETAVSSLNGPKAFSDFQSLIAEALEWHRTHRTTEPRELLFEGTVVDTAGRPVPMAQLSLVAMERDGDGYRSANNPQAVHARTDSAGRFVFGNLANTHHTLRVIAEGFGTRDGLGVMQLSDGRFRISDGGEGNVIVLEKPASLSGQVIGLDGRPLANATVHFWSYPTHGVPRLGQLVLDEQGRFAESPVMSGDHLVLYAERKQIDGAQEYEGVTAFHLVQVAEGQEVDDAVLDLGQSTAALEVEIVDRDGRPVGADHLALEIAIPSGKPSHTSILYLSDVKPRSVHRFPNLPPVEGYVSVTVMGRPPERVPVRLLPNQTTRCRIELGESTDRSALATPKQGQTDVVLPEADRGAMILDLAMGELVPMPPAGPEPEKTQQALRELGKGDIVYDVDLGDRSLIFLRDAKSDPPGEDAGEPFVTGHLIGRTLPETLTVITKEGQRYEVTILAADERSCTLKYSRVPAGRDASGGAPVEPENAGGALELRIVPTWNELAPEVIAEYRKSLIEGRTPADSRYLWFWVRPGTNPPGAITEMHAGKLWLLVHNTELFIMVPSQGWEIAHVSRGADQNGRPMISLEFDSAGAERMLQLTRVNDNHPLAMIVSGVVVSAPNITSGGTGFRQALILGNFTEQEVEDLIASLRRGMVRRSSAEAQREPLQTRGVVTDAAEQGTDLQAARSSRTGISGQVFDPNGNPVPRAQVALCTKDKGVIVQAGGLLPTTWGNKTSEIVETDAQGRFSFPARPDEFHLIAACDKGFVWRTGEELAASDDLRLELWGRVEGMLKIGRRVGAGERVNLFDSIRNGAIGQNIRYDYQTETDSAGRFVFKQVPPGWMEIGYMIRVGDSTSTYTSRTPIRLESGQNLKMTLGGEGRPVIGRFVPPADYKERVYFGAGLRAFATSRPELPQPENHERMTQREQAEWRKEWLETPQARAFYEAIWHDLDRRHYAFRIEKDGTFRIEDVIPGQYTFTVWLEEEERSGNEGPREFGSYHGTVEVPPTAEAYSDKPLDVGDLVLKIRPPLYVGDTAPLFEARTLDGKDIRLADYRGRFVLLAFWSPVFHPELDRLKELHATYGGTGKLQIIGLGGTDTLDEVRKYVEEHGIEWPEIYFGPDWDAQLLRQLGGQMQIMLIDPAGKIVATWLREEKLTKAVQDALGEAGRPDRVPLKLEYPDLPEPRASAYSEEYYLTTTNYRMPLAEEPPVVLVPPDVTNVATGKPVTSNSPTEPILGDIEDVTDGNKMVMRFVEFEPLLSPRRPIYVTIDLGREYEIHAVAWWHDFHRPSIYQDVVVRVARDPQFQDAAILYNNDFDDSLGFGKGKDPAYVETNKGWVAGASGVHGRYVRLYNSGSPRNLCSQFTEVEVYGRQP